MGACPPRRASARRWDFYTQVKCNDERVKRRRHVRAERASSFGEISDRIRAVYLKWSLEHEIGAVDAERWEEWTEHDEVNKQGQVPTKKFN